MRGLRMFYQQCSIGSVSLSVDITSPLTTTIHGTRMPVRTTTGMQEWSCVPVQGTRGVCRHCVWWGEWSRHASRNHFLIPHHGRVLGSTHTTLHSPLLQESTHPHPPLAPFTSHLPSTSLPPHPTPSPTPAHSSSHLLTPSPCTFLPPGEKASYPL